MTAARTASIALVWLLGCAPGRIERIEYVDGQGMVRRVDLPRQCTGAEVAARLGRPNVIRRGPGEVVYWLYTFEHVRHNYVLTFRGDRLAHVRTMPRAGS